jgi:hypothetical protein
MSHVPDQLDEAMKGEGEYRSLADSLARACAFEGDHSWMHSYAQGYRLRTCKKCMDIEVFSRATGEWSTAE